jgi:Uma2 family endonuclease
MSNAPKLGELGATEQDGDIIAPTAAEWAALSAREQEQLLIRINSALTEQALTMGEGRPHGRAKSAALDQLSKHFARIGRRIYLADALTVHYPGEAVFVPDILAVLDVDDPGDDDARLAWVVAHEGKGIDLALEIAYAGDRKKDLVRNVERYARLRIPEYFVYDRLRQHVSGNRLPHPAASRYEPIKPHFGRLASAVLGLDLAVVGGRLRFFHGNGEVPGSGELIEELGRMLDELGARADEERARADEARARADEERARAEAARARELERLREMIFAILSARGLSPSDEVRAGIGACVDEQRLADWAVRAAVVVDVSELVEG